MNYMINYVAASSGEGRQDVSGPYCRADQAHKGAVRLAAQHCRGLVPSGLVRCTSGRARGRDWSFDPHVPVPTGSKVRFILTNSLHLNFACI